MRTLLSTIATITIAMAIIGTGHAESAYQSCAIVNPSDNGRMFIYTWNATEFDYNKTTVTVTESLDSALVAQCNDESIRLYDGTIVPFTTEDVETPNSWELTGYAFTPGKPNGMPIDGQVTVGGVTYHVEFKADHEDMIRAGDRVVISGTDAVVWYSGEYERMMVSSLVMTPVQEPVYTVVLPLVAN